MPKVRHSSDRTPRHAGRDQANRCRRGLTCANCRERKTRCDGSQPGCKTCEVYGVECRYEKPPPMSQILALAKRLQETEQTVTELRAALDEARESNLSRQAMDSVQSSHSHDSPFGNTLLAGATLVETGSTQMEADHMSVSEQGIASDLSLDENGKLCYYGPTSAVHAPPPESTNNDDSHNYKRDLSTLNARSVLTSNALESKTWEEFALGNAEMQIDTPRHMISKLLQIHWTWVAPMFNWVYRPVFTRDMAIGGPYYSPFLLIVMCAHAARFDNANTSDLLVSRARLLLGTEIQRPSSVPAAQALLQLSARELAYGSISQAWLYSGMAFRMVSDMGLHHSTARIATLGNLTPEDLEVRRRLFWSCYFWDKAISLFLGRMPVLLELPFEGFPEFLDDSAENDIWTPYYGDLTGFEKRAPEEYPTMKSHLVSNFQNSCKLAIILSDIILQLYSRRGNVNANESMRDIRRKLNEWREQSPVHLKYDADSLPQICPPPHILTQNLLYYTAIILLHRPFYSIPSHHASCRAAADRIQKLLLLLEGSFGFTRITYIMGYCTYTGASVMMQDLKKGDSEAQVKMQTFLQALRQGTRTCPILQRSLDIITNGLRSEILNVSTAETGSSTHEENVSARNYLPAFPYRDFNVRSETNFGQANVGFESFSLLDCFPEAQYDILGTMGDCSFPAA